MGGYNRFLDSADNLFDIQPIRPDKIYDYYLGVYFKLKNAGVKQKELYERKHTPSGSGIEYYFPLIVEAMNKRGNWRCLNRADAMNMPHIDFSWTNASKISGKSSIIPRLLLNSTEHYISSKSAFYEKFKKYDFISKFMPITKSNIYKDVEKINSQFCNKAVIIKPDFGKRSSDIKILNRYNFFDVCEHIMNSPYELWSISEVVISKLIKNRINSLRIYLLITKTDNNYIRGYIYGKFIVNLAMRDYNGDISDPEMALSNYIPKNDQKAKDDFYLNRYIPCEEYLGNFTKAERDDMFNKITSAFRIICDTVKDDLLAHNDNKAYNDVINGFPSQADNIQSFHLYGVDAIVDNDNKVTILEINGAPAISDKCRMYKNESRIDHFKLIDDTISIAVDPICPPKNDILDENLYIQIYEGYKSPKYTPLYYIPNSITCKYPFILDVLEERKYLKRTKNMHDKIDLFYGLRERYVTDETNLNYYDELLNYVTSKRTRDARIINKIQGITYYLANKGRMYNKLLETYDKERVHFYHPISDTFTYDGNYDNIYNRVYEIIRSNPTVRRWILKPVHGSRGLGINIFKKKNSFFNLFNFNIKPITCDIVNHIIHASDKGYDIMVNGENVNKRYTYWMLSQYLHKPHLINRKKYNLRFYVLLNIRRHIPTYKDLEDIICDDVIDTYISRDFMIYYSMLDYDAKELPYEYRELDPDIYLSKMKSLTNLEIVNNVYDELGDPIGKDYMKDKLTDMLHNIISRNSNEYNMLCRQAEHIVRDTINAVKYDLRPLNRYLEQDGSNKFLGCFNLLAYDTLIDEDMRMWLIEINRGPDIKGLEKKIGTEGCKDMFDEIFSITVDPFYTDLNRDEINDNLVFFKKLNINYKVISK